MAAIPTCTCTCSRFVYVGNIPHHASEAEVRSACEDIGPVVSLTLAVDKPTGKRKGYAFCEYLDDETARSALRNLNGHLLLGRQLRVGLRRQRLPIHPDRPVGLQEATHAACLVSGRPDDVVTRLLATQTPRQLEEFLTTMGRLDPTCVKIMEERMPVLATGREQAQLIVGRRAAVVEEEEKERQRKQMEAEAAAEEEKAKERQEQRRQMAARERAQIMVHRLASAAAAVAKEKENERKQLRPSSGSPEPSDRPAKMRKIGDGTLSVPVAASC